MSSRGEGASDRRSGRPLRLRPALEVCAEPLDYPGCAHGAGGQAQSGAAEERIELDPRVALEMAKGAGLVGRKSSGLDGAGTTRWRRKDTVTMIRAAIRGCCAWLGLESVELRAAPMADDSCYESAGKPVCDWSDEGGAREAIVDALAKDGYALLLLLDGKQSGEPVGQAALPLATVLWWWTWSSWRWSARHRSALLSQETGGSRPWISWKPTVTRRPPEASMRWRCTSRWIRI